MPHPVLSNIFVLSMDGDLIDITPLAKDIIEQEGSKFLRELERTYEITFMRGGKLQTRTRSVATGRFIKRV